MNVSNRKCIRNISFKSMKASKTRNIIAIIAIALTSILFTVLFTISMSIVYGFEQSNFRMVGGYSHAGFKSLTADQCEELREDPLIKEYGLRRYLGMPSKEPFNKSHVELSWADANCCKWMFLKPIEGRFPEEGTNEAATDTQVLALLGVEPEIGAQFSITFDVDGNETTETFTLCGWWEYDTAIIANHVILPESRVDEILTNLDTQCLDGMTGLYNLDVMFKNSSHIEKDMYTILERHGYQTDDASQNNFINIGINWGYAGAQLSDNFDLGTLLSIAIILFLIVFTGYLIIYNVFQISVSNDIRFYGLLKTIGTTGRQLKRMVFLQAIFLSVIGIPIGLLIGYATGAILTPFVISTLNGVMEGALSVNPLIFIVSALFSLITVVISCRKPGRMAAKVSPIEALRYSDGVQCANKRSKKTTRNAKTGASIYKMAFANMGRNRKKTLVTIISLSLAVVILTITVTFVKGFDINKYVSLSMNVDFILSDAAYFQGGTSIMNMNNDSVEEDIINIINEQHGITESGRTYEKTSTIETFTPKQHILDMYNQFGYNEDYVNSIIDTSEKKDDLILNSVQLYGMEPFCLEQLKVAEGDISKLNGDGNYIAAQYFDDDDGNLYPDTNWAKLGDKVVIRYTDEYEYYNPQTGKVYDSFDDIASDDLWRVRPVSYHEVEYEVAALVVIPNSLTYRYKLMQDEFVLGAETFKRDTGTDAVMYYAFNMDENAIDDMEDYIADLTENVMPRYDYESRKTYAEDFNSFVNMFMILGSVLSFIIGFIGILNFLNAFLTSIVSRHREFAVLQSVGMTGSQLKKMLIAEGEILTLGSVLLSFILIVVTGPIFSNVISSVFWFFTYKFSIMPFVIITPIFAVLGVLLPMVAYKVMAGKSIVERLRDAE
ncbi:MAG: ABC transporter permease [Lachnospiraceae bacterium]|nr:ABC transporter permease [Lachnospiraceae bacterium]